MKKMLAGSFKAKCLVIMDEVQAKHEAVVITKRGKPVAKFVPVSTETDEIYNFLAGKGVIAGDVVSPAVSPGASSSSVVSPPPSAKRACSASRSAQLSQFTPGEA